jgi:hypothetical protein
MGFFNKFKKNSSNEDNNKEKNVPLGKYSNEPCALCGATGSEKKWLGQFWHKKCLRQAKKGAKKMI